MGIWPYRKQAYLILLGETCVRDFCESLREYAKKYHWTLKIKKMLPLTKKELKSYQGARNCYICRKTIFKKLFKKKALKKVKIFENLVFIVIMQVNIEAQHIVFII